MGAAGSIALLEVVSIVRYEERHETAMIGNSIYDVVHRIPILDEGERLDRKRILEAELYTIFAPCMHGGNRKVEKQQYRMV